jgi:hypothetical protein
MPGWSMAVDRRRHAGDADAVRGARKGQQTLQQRLRLRHVGILGALDQGDGAAEHGAIAGAYAVSVFLQRRCVRASHGLSMGRIARACKGAGDPGLPSACVLGW